MPAEKGKSEPDDKEKHQTSRTSKAITGGIERNGYQLVGSREVKNFFRASQNRFGGNAKSSLVVLETQSPDFSKAVLL